MILTDKYHRRINYLRLAVTDRCNLRCRYCMPEEGIDFSSRSDLLSYEELDRLTQLFAELGVTKIRLTGGEPFVRKDIDILLRALRRIFQKVHITTNATLLHNHFDVLQEIQVDGLNISIDSLDRDRFFMITRRDTYDQVMDNILQCKSLCIPIKLNIVAMNGVNSMEIVDFVRFGMEHDIEVRFIEAMPFNDDDGNKDVFISQRDIHAIVKEAFPSSKKVEAIGSSDMYTIDDKYTYGIIPAYTRSLCGSCNRVRLSPKGKMMTCLYATDGLDLRAALRDTDVTDEDIVSLIQDAILQKKKDGYEEEKSRSETVFQSMTTIGG